jgi:phenylalanine-4-hydroxylase
LEFEVPREKTHKIAYSEDERRLFGLYGEVRSMREEGKFDAKRLSGILEQLISAYPGERLLPLEIYELGIRFPEDPALSSRVSEHLEALAKDIKTGHLIKDGLRMASYT